MKNSDIFSIVNDLKHACISIYRCLEENYNFGMTTNSLHNKSGDNQTALDIKCNDIFINTLKKNRYIKYIASEESPEIIPINKDGKYIVVFDPLDGSGNIDVELCLGSIFAIFKDNSKDGKDILFAGYCLYTYKCFMVYSYGNNIVYKDYILERKTFQITRNKENSKYCCINSKFSNLIDSKNFLINDVKNYRWSGCMVSDVHRIIVNTGYFCYPEKKLRLLYECYPMAFLIHNVGGKSNLIEKDYQKDYQITNNILDLPYPGLDIHKKVGILIYNPGQIYSKL